MTEEISQTDDEQHRIHNMLASRRRFLEAAGAAGFVAGVGGIASGQQAETTYEFAGEVAGWEGRSPQEIDGETNPTLDLDAGTEYEIVWENLDGQPHDFVIQDADGNELEGTEIVDEQGATRSFTFTATEEMDQYICTVHPSSMVGDVQVGATDTQDDEEVVEAERFVPEGPTVGVEQIADGPLVNPVTLRPVPGKENTHLVVDQTGEIYVLQDDELQDEPFLDLSDDVLILEEAKGGFDNPPGFDERGLLGLDFHPEFEENRQFYVRYSSRDPVDGDEPTGPDQEFPEDWDHVEVLSEFTVDGHGDGMDDHDDDGMDDHDDDGMGDDSGMGDDTGVCGSDDGAASLKADRDSERVLLEVPTPQFNHNGGEVVFGPDGYLYTSLGDGGDGNDTGVGHGDDWYDDNEGGNAQNVEANLLGTVIRIDVDQQANGLPYCIPEDNPLVDTSGYNEIFAYGLRNPWRMSFNDDQLIAADVGQALFEEVDVIENGGNYGWNVKEGFHCFNADDATSPPENCPDSEPDEEPYDGSEFVEPVLEYPHRYQNESVGISITGGYVYEGDEVGDLDGRYVFGDWSANFANPEGRIFVATPEESTTGGMDEDESGADDEETPAESDQEETPEDEGEGDSGEDKGEQEVPSAEEEVDLKTPDEQPWQWEELMIEGGGNQKLNRFVQGFGRDANGELYVLASRTGRVEGTDGEVYRLVPAGEGEEIEEEEEEEQEGEEQEEEGEGE